MTFAPLVLAYKREIANSTTQKNIILQLNVRYWNNHIDSTTLYLIVATRERENYLWIRVRQEGAKRYVPLPADVGIPFSHLANGTDRRMNRRTGVQMDKSQHISVCLPRLWWTH